MAQREFPPNRLQSLQGSYFGRDVDSTVGRARVTNRAGRITLPLLLLTALLLPAAGCGKPFKRHEHVALTASGPVHKLIVRNQMGDIVIRTDQASDGIQAEARKTGKGTVPDQAIRALDETVVTLSPSNDDPTTVVASVHRESPDSSSWRHCSVDWDLTAPPGIIVVAQSEFGDITAKGDLAGATARTQFGDVRINSTGPVEIDTEFGDVVLKLLPGESDRVKVHTEFGDVIVCVPKNRKGKVLGSTEFGSVSFRLEDALARIVLQESHHCEVKLGGEETPTLEMTTEFGDVRVKTK